MAHIYDEMWFCMEYLQKKKSIREIAELCEMSPTTVARQLKKYNIHARNAKDALISRYEKREHHRKGINFTEEHKRKISDSHKGVKFSHEHKRKISYALTGRKQSEIHIRNHSKSMIGLLIGEKNSNWHGGSEERRCLICGKSFDVGRAEITKGNGLYCSKSCAAKSRVGENSPHWRGGISYEPYCSKFNRALKEKIRNRDNRICFLCGKSEIENRERLSIHHVDNNKMQGCNKKWYLISLCRSCHGKVHNDKIEEVKLILKIGELNI
jgi:hypothetical protein